MSKSPNHSLTGVLAAALFLAAVWIPAQAATLITDIRFEETPSTFSFVVQATAPATPKAFMLLTYPPRLVVDFPDSRLEGPAQKGKANSPIAGWRLAQTSLDPDVVRLVIDWEGSPEAHTIETGPRNSTRVIITKRPEVVSKPAPTPEASSLPSVEVSSHIEKIIEETPATREAFPAIDPTPQIALPDMNALRSLTLTSSTLTIDFPTSLPVIDNTTYVPAKEFCRALGMTLTYSVSQKTFEAIRGEELKIEGKIGDKILRVNHRDRLLPAPPRVIKNALHLPLASVLKNMGLGVLWDDSSKTLHVRPRLISIRAETIKGTPTLLIKTSEPRSVTETVVTTTPLTLNLLIPDVIVEPGTLEVSSPDIFSGGTTEQDSAGNARIKLWLTRKALYAIDEDPLTTSIRISFPSGVQLMPVTETERDIKIAIQATSRLTPQILTLKDPYRIVVDLPGTLNRIAPSLTIEKSSVVRMRSSQFKIDPPTTRLVIDLSQEGPFEQTLSEDGTQLTLSILKPAEVARREKAKQFAALKNRIIVIDAGHGGHDPGSRSVSGLEEKRLTLKVATILSRRLAEAGATPLLSREDDSYISLQDRVEFAERNRAELLISVHFNAFDTREKHGTETYYETPQSLALASIVHKHMVTGIRRADRGVRRVKFYVIHHASMPAVLVEPLYITNPDEDRLVRDEAFLEELAGDLFNGILEYCRRFK